VASAATARRNLAAFLDEVHAFSPVQGELTLRAFLEYVDALVNRPETRVPAEHSRLREL